MMTKKKIIDNLQTAFNGDPWYGYSIMKIIQSISIENINNNFKDGNSIGQILEHILAWRNFSIEPLKGNFLFKIEINSKEDWNKNKHYSLEEWQQLVERLKENQTTLIELTEDKSDEFLKSIIPERKYTYFTLLENSIQHDLYHLGQIALLNK